MVVEAPVDDGIDALDVHSSDVVSGILELSGV